MLRATLGGLRSGLAVPTDDGLIEAYGLIRPGGALLGAQRHICAFFNTHDDQYRVLLPFTKDGFERGEKAVHIIDPRRREEHLRQLESVGIDAGMLQETGRLELHEWADTHLRGGSFDPIRTRAAIEDISQRSKREGFQRVRFYTDMDWAVEAPPGVDVLLEYESRVNLVPTANPVICAYDLARSGGDWVVDVMRTHPLIIIGGILQENPFFVPPDAFLRELRERRGA